LTSGRTCRQTAEPPLNPTIGLLKNFGTFSGRECNPWQDAWLYLEEVEKTPLPSIKYAKDHVLSLFGGAL
jgi:hypothetical protein